METAPIATLSSPECIKMGSNESHFNVSLIVKDKVTRQCPQISTFEEKGEPKRIRTEDPPLTQLLGHHQNDSCMKMGSDESLLICITCDGQSHKTMSTDHNF